MSESGNNTQAYPVPVRPPFPFERLFYALAFAVIAWFLFPVLVVLGIAQFAVYAIEGHANEELKSFTRRLACYLWELLTFICFARDEKPFPFGPFPKEK
ncbi:MAG: DUF4389 domain-containing protein [Alphaproteobacteria bacterium]|nr:DUF4389 domain-containing protein [Alphaproteobacteria bacterium]